MFDVEHHVFSRKCGKRLWDNQTFFGIFESFWFLSSS
jgi:hypothetical protein